MKKLDKNIETRVCRTCSKKKVLDIGFSKVTETNYLKDCKECKKAYHRDREHKLKNYTLETHSWTEETSNLMSYCKRCGLERRRKAHPVRFGGWISSYMVNRKWEERVPKCIF